MFPDLILWLSILGGDVYCPERPLQCRRCQRFGRTQRCCCYALRSVAFGEARLLGECLRESHSSSINAATVEETTQPTTGAVLNRRRIRRCMLSGRMLNAVRGGAPPSYRFEGETGGADH
jgi:hypothetical protein